MNGDEWTEEETKDEDIYSSIAQRANSSLEKKANAEIN